MDEVSRRIGLTLCVQMARGVKARLIKAKVKCSTGAALVRDVLLVDDEGDAEFIDE